ncbi:MAG: MAPEG family protein [Terricaulis sp.]
MIGPSLAVAALYIGLCALFLLVLSLNVGLRRGSQKALEPGATGDGALIRAIRAHGNFAEFAPTVLLILLALSLLQTPQLTLHVLGAGFLIARLFHTLGMQAERHPNALRLIGNIGTWLVLLIGGALCILAFLRISAL